MPNHRVLVISHDPFSELGSNGRTYSSIFSQFNTSQISQLFFNNLKPSSKIFNTFFRVTEIDIVKFLLSFSQIKISGNIQKEEITSIKARKMKRSLIKSELIKILRNFFHSIVKIQETNSFNIWIKKYKPSVVFFVGTNYTFMYKIVSSISTKYDIPYYIYFTDDYFLYNDGKNFITKFLHKRFIEKSKVIVKGAEELFVISPKMKQEYEQYFGKKCTILINAVDKGELPITKVKLENPVIFRYFGWLHSNRSSSLCYLGQCLTFINEHYNLNCILEIYTLTIPVGNTKIDLTMDCIHICEPLMGEELKQKVSSSDFLVHAESFEPEDKQVMCSGSRSRRISFNKYF
jgi:hypothetical protein